MEYINFTKCHIVLGSGLSGISVAKTLLSNGKKVVMIDAGFTSKSKSNQNEYKNYKKKFSSPKFKTNNKSYVYSGFSKYINIIENNFSSIGSLALGGLSNIWGAGLNPYTFDELDRFPYEYDDVKKFYKETTKLLLNRNKLEEDYLRSTQKIDHRCLRLIKKKSMNYGLKFKFPFNAVTENASKEIESNEIFTASSYLDVLKKNSNFTYISGKLILNVLKEAGHYKILCKEIYNGKNINFISNKIYFCLGTLSTTKIVLKMKKKYNYQIPLLTTPAGVFFLFSSSKRKLNEKDIVISNLSYELVESNIKISGNIFPFNDSIGKLTYLKNKFPLAYKIVDVLILSRFLIGNMYFSSEFSNNTISLDEKDNLIINGKNKNKIYKNFSDFTKKIFNAFKSEKLFLLPYKKLLRPGEDIHYGGTLPIGSSNDLGCNQLGELNGFNNIFICDSSSLPFLPGKAHSFNTMVQSMFIANESSKN